VTNSHPRQFASIVISVIALSLAGCGQAEPEAVPTPSATPTSSATPTADPFARPDSAFDVTCDELVPLATMVELYGAGAQPISIDYAGIAESRLQFTAALTDGALICQWGLTGSPVPVATLTATPASAEQFAIAAAGFDELPRPTPPVPILDGARASCDDGFPGDTSRVRCQWTTYRDGVWLVAAFSDMPASEVDPPTVRDNPDTSGNPATARLDSVSTRIIVEAAEKLRDAVRPDWLRSSSPLTTCDEVVDRVVSELSGTITFGQSYDRTQFVPRDTWSSSADSGWGIGSLAIERLGWTSCGIEIPTDGLAVNVSIIVAQNAAWVLRNDLPSVVTLEALSGVDGVIGCASDEGGAQCYAAIAVGAHVVAVTADSTIDAELTRSLVVAAAGVLN
jgi:hypothetical protein